MVLLGSGDQEIEQYYQELKQTYPHYETCFILISVSCSIHLKITFLIYLHTMKRRITLLN